MTKLDALKELLAKVEAGEDLPVRIPNWWTSKQWLDATWAYYGSLDAALALHEAVLPEGVEYCVTPEGATVYFDDGQEDGDLTGNPARAWFIAIIKALIAMEPEQ